jgi:hypothetical protein
MARNRTIKKPRRLFRKHREDQSLLKLVGRPQLQATLEIMSEGKTPEKLKEVAVNAEGWLSTILARLKENTRSLAAKWTTDSVGLATGVSGWSWAGSSPKGRDTSRPSRVGDND